MGPTEIKDSESLVAKVTVVYTNVGIPGIY